MFDWNDRTSIEYLRKWLIQKTGRIVQTNLREAGQPMSIEEKQFLKALVDDAFVQHTLRNADKSDAELKSTFRLSADVKNEWERKWNARFAGKTVASEYDARRARVGQNLYTLVKRWKKLCDLYGFKFDTHGTTTDDNEDQWPWETKVESKSDQETASEGENEGEDE